MFTIRTPPIPDTQFDDAIHHLCLDCCSGILREASDDELIPFGFELALICDECHSIFEIQIDD